MILRSSLIWSFAQIIANTAVLTLVGQSAFWLISGIILCAIELFFAKTVLAKYKLVALIAGIVALILGLFMAVTAIGDYPLIPKFEWQIAYWMGLSIVSVIWVRPMLLKGKKFTIREATEGKTLTEILPGETGRVLYEGTSWQARCETTQLTIAPNQKVYVVRQEGTTLIVVPENLLHS